MRHPARLTALLLVGLGVLQAGGARAELGGYVAEIEKWREHFDADVRSGGWLTLVGRTKLDEGTWTLGSDTKSALVLPSKAPGELGVLSRRGSAFRFEPAAGAAVTLGGNAVVGAVDLPTKPGSDRLASGDLTVAVRQIGDDFYMLVADTRGRWGCQSVGPRLGRQVDGADDRVAAQSVTAAPAGGLKGMPLPRGLKPQLAGCLGRQYQGGLRVTAERPRALVEFRASDSVSHPRLRTSASKCSRHFSISAR